MVWVYNQEVALFLKVVISSGLRGKTRQQRPHVHAMVEEILHPLVLQGALVLHGWCFSLVWGVTPPPHSTTRHHLLFQLEQVFLKLLVGFFSSIRISRWCWFWLFRHKALPLVLFQ